MTTTPQPRPVRVLEFNPLAGCTADDVISVCHPLPPEQPKNGKASPAAKLPSNGKTNGTCNNPSSECETKVREWATDQARQTQLQEWIKNQATRWIGVRDPSVEGQAGDMQLYKTVCEVLLGFNQSPSNALDVVLPWDQHNQPPFGKDAIEDKISNALKNGTQELGGKIRWDKILELTLEYDRSPVAPPQEDHHQAQGEDPPREEKPAPKRGVIFEVRSARIDLTKACGTIFNRKHPTIAAKSDKHPPQATLCTTIEVIKEYNQRHERFFFGPDGLSHLNLQDENPEIKPLTPTSLQTKMGEIANFVSVTWNHKKEMEQLTPEQPPKWLAEQIVQMSAEDLGVPEVDLFLRTPVFDAECNLLEKTGYYRSSRIALKIPSTLKIPPVSQTPTKEEVKRARLSLEFYLYDFPFVAQSDRANNIGLIVSPFVRKITGKTPLTIFAAATRGTGKGLDLMASLAPFSGLSASYEYPRPEVIEMPELGKEEEAGKLICSALLAGPSILVMDNIERKIDSPLLAMVLTSSSPSFRRLGQNRMVTLQNNCVWVGSANNPTYSDEIARRVVTIRLDAGMEHPEERTGFQTPDILAFAREQRPTLIWAILTLVRNWVAQGCPPGGQVLGSFQQWASTIGGILGASGIDGFLDNRREVLAKSDPDSQEWSAFFGAWAEDFGTARVSTKDLVTIIRRINAPSAIFRAVTDQAQLTALGMALSKREGRIFGGLKLEFAGYESGRKQYRLKPNATESEAPPAPPHPDDDEELFVP